MPTASSPTARALLTLELLQAGPGITADRLAERLGVTERAARRYVSLLREAGIPIESTRGRYGGYRVGRGLRLPPLVFTSDEALGLVMAALDGHHDVGDPTDPVGSAFGKIMRALPAPVADQAQVLRQSAAPAPDRGAVRPDPETTSTLVRACAAHRQIQVDYRSEAGTEWSARVDPWAIVIRHGRWYLLCHSHAAHAVRTYRVDRVRSVLTLESTFTPPADLDPVRVLEQHLALGWEYDVQVVIDGPVERVRRYLPPALGRLTRADDQRCRLQASTSDPAWYVQQLALLPVDYRIAGGDEIRAAARAAASRMAAAADAETP